MSDAIKASDYGAVTAYLIVNDANAAIAFYEKVLGAKERYRLLSPDGQIAHAEFQIGDTVLMIASENAQWGTQGPLTLGGSSVTFNASVADPDRTLLDAQAAGGAILTPAADHFYGYRSGRFQDPFGHMWMVSKVLEELTRDEMQKRMDAMFSGQASREGHEHE